MDCLNCKNEVEGSYCSNCGQKATAMRYTLNGILRQTFYSVTEIDDKGIVHTMKKLSLEPGKSIRNYIDGKRMQLYPPVKYLFFVGAIGTFLVLRYHFMSLTTEENQQGLLYVLFANVFPFLSAEFLNRFFLYAEEFTTVVNILTIPVFSLFTFIYFRKYEINFAETLILNTYITGHQLLLLIPFIIPNELFPAHKSTFIDIYGIITMVYNIWVLITFFRIPFLQGLYRSFFAIIMAYLAQFIINIGIFYIVSQAISMFTFK